MDLVVLIDSPQFTLSSSSRVLKRSDTAVVTQAAELLESASARGQQMLEQQRLAHEKARQRGWRQGTTEAKAEWASRLAAASAARHVALTDLGPTLVNIVVDAVSVVLKNTDRQTLMAGALAAVDGLLRQARWAKLRVHPSQVETARAVLSGDEAESKNSVAAVVTLVADASIQVDDCIFETDIGIADASLSVQLAAIRSALEGSVMSLLATTQSDPAAVEPS